MTNYKKKFITVPYGSMDALNNKIIRNNKDLFITKAQNEYCNKQKPNATFTISPNYGDVHEVA